MISQAEYLANSMALQDLGTNHKEQLQQELVGVKNLDDSIKVTQKRADLYHRDYEDLLASALADTGNTTADHYNRILNLGLSDDEKQEVVAAAILKQPHEPYYGANLNQRLAHSRMENQRRIRASARVGATLATRQINLTRIFVDPYPFGSQVSHDQRIMLGQCVKLEHDIALVMASKGGIDIVRWTLSHRHKQKDICDEYAEAIDPGVVAYLTTREIRIDPHGCYFAASVPDPPHPNCQCTLEMLRDGHFVPNLVDRAVEKLRELLDSLRRRRRRRH